MKDEFNTSSDIDVEKEKRKNINSTISNTLWSGVIIGIGICICVFGMLQQCQALFDASATLAGFVQQYWFSIPWWYWIGPLLFFIIMYFYFKYQARKALQNGRS